MPRLTSADVACWLIKSRTPASEIGGGWAAGTTKELTRCLRRSYRVELMRPGQLCLLWVSGRVQPGVQALGRVVSEATPAPLSEENLPQMQVTVLLRRLTEPVPRAAWLADHLLTQAEVIKMPAGSNPSYVSPETFDALQDHLDPAELAPAGW